MVGKRAVKSGFILSFLAPAYPPYKSGVKKKSSKSLNRHTPAALSAIRRGRHHKKFENAVANFKIRWKAFFITEATSFLIDKAGERRKEQNQFGTKRANQFFVLQLCLLMILI